MLKYLTMELDFATFDKAFNKYRQIYKKLLNLTMKQLDIKCDPIVSVSIISNDDIHKINKEYRNIDRETDVISFAFLDNEENRDSLLKSNAPVVLGDIYIASEVAKAHAIEYGNTLEREMKFLFVHGLLHLLGYDHMKKEDEEIMFPLQEKILEAEKK